MIVRGTKGAGGLPRFLPSFGWHDVCESEERRTALLARASSILLFFEKNSSSRLEIQKKFSCCRLIDVEEKTKKMVVSLFFDKLSPTLPTHTRTSTHPPSTMASSSSTSGRSEKKLETEEGVKFLASMMTTLGRMSEDEATAFKTPAATPPPPPVCSGFRSASEAEAAGWVCNAVHVRWEMPDDALKKIKTLEDAVKGLTEESMQAMGLDELRRAFQAISACGTGRLALFDGDESEEALREKLKNIVPNIKALCRDARKTKNRPA